MIKREMININNFFNLVAEDLQLGKVLENPVQVAGGFMHRMPILKVQEMKTK